MTAKNAVRAVAVTADLGITVSMLMVIIYFIKTKHNKIMLRPSSWRKP
jgi:hypothetical protein